MGTLQPLSNGPLYSNTVNTLAVDGWAVTFGTARRGLGGLRPAQSLLAVPNVTAHPSTASVPTSYCSMWYYNCLCALNFCEKTLRSGLVRDAPSLWGIVAFHPCSLEGLSSHQVNMLECLGWFFRLTSASRSMFPTSARPASTICVNYGTSGAHWLRSLPRRSCTPSWHQQVATSVELGSSCSQWYTEVRSRSEAADAYWAPLA